MATNENLIPIPGRLHSVATEGHVAGANEIYDDSLSKDQQTINAEVQTALGTGGTVDQKIESAINALDSAASQTAASANGYLNLSVTETNGKVTAISGSIDDAAYIDDTESSPAVVPSFDPTTDTVHVTAQTLSESQKAQVRTNIGLGDVDAKINQAVASEASQRAAAVSGVQSSVNAESSRAQAKEAQLQNNIEALTQSDIVVVADHTQVASPDSLTIYREQGTNTYSDWMYQNGSWKKMAEYDNAIDDAPVFGSANLVKSDGITKDVLLQKGITVWAPNGFIRNVYEDGNNLAVVLENFTIYGINGTYYPWTSFTEAGNTYQLGNVHGLVADLTNGTVSAVYLDSEGNFVNNVQGSKKVLLCVCVGKKLYSPIPSIQDDLLKLYELNPYLNQIKSCMVVALGENPDNNRQIIKSISKSGNTLTVSLNAFVLIGTNKYYTWQNFAASGELTLNNVDAIIADNDALTLSVVSFDGGGFRQNVTGKNKVILFMNFSGRLMSPIPSLNDELEEYYNTINGEYKNIVTVAPSGGDYTSVRAAVNSITDATIFNKYKVFVKNGTYDEIDIETKDYVDIVGESKDGVILRCDGLSSSLAPSGYGLPMWTWLDDYSGQPISEIPEAYKHLFIHMSESTIENLTMIVNNVKYAIHQDGNSRKYNAVVENCKIIRQQSYSDGDYTSLVGIGSLGGQYQNYKDCEFYQRINNLPAINELDYAFVWHNWNNQTEKSAINIDGCNFFGCNVANINELGSEQDDVVTIKNSKVDRPQFGVRYTATLGYYMKNGVVVQDIDQLPYCITVNIIDSDINFVVPQNDRVLGYKKISDAGSLELDKISSVLTGQPIKPNMIGNGSSTIATGKDFVFAVTDSESGFVIANKGLVGLGLCVAGTYLKNDAVYISDGKFTKTQSGEQVAVCLEDMTLSADGLVKIQKL